MGEITPGSEGALMVGALGVRLSLSLPGQRQRVAYLIHKSEQIRTYGLPGGRDAGFHGRKIAEFAANRAM